MLATQKAAPWAWSLIRTTFSLPSSKSLWDVVKQDLLEGHAPEEITTIWMQVGSLST
jgi:hypothetical protein